MKTFVQHVLFPGFLYSCIYKQADQMIEVLTIYIFIILIHILIHNTKK